MSNEPKTEVRETAADIKKRIEQAKQDLKDSGRPITGQVANEINATESTPAVTNQVEVKSDPQTAATKGLEAPKSTENNVDLQEWAKKRGIDWTTEETVLSALRKSDQEFHKRQAERKAQEQAQPSYIPPPQYIPQQPVYAPPQFSQPPAPNRAMIEKLAIQYRMTVEDVERLLDFNRDYFQAALQTNPEIQMERVRVQNELATIKRENQKNSVFRELSADPVFRNPEVGAEFTRVLDEMQASDPQSFELDPTAYRRAYDRTLANIGRRNLEGRPLQEGVPPIARPPTNPPKSLGRGSGGGALENENEIDMQQWNRLSPEDKRKWFQERGLVQTY